MAHRPRTQVLPRGLGTDPVGPGGEAEWPHWLVLVSKGLWHLLLSEPPQ